MTAKKLDTVQSYNVFVSSTWTDMQNYRESVRNALLKAGCIPCGMENYPASSNSPLKTCFEEMGKCQVFVCVLGMRYGSVDEKTGKSYTQLEYEKAVELGLPILAFLIDEEKATFKRKDVDIGELGVKLDEFKKYIKDSKEVTCAFFDSPSSLSDLVFRSITSEIKRRTNAGIDNPEENAENYKLGAELFRKFIKRPLHYRNAEAILRVRFDGLYSGWRIREAVFEAFGFVPGDTLFLNDINVIGCDFIDVKQNEWLLDCFANSGAADWIDSNDIKPGMVFEGKFKFVYEMVKDGAGSMAGDFHDSMIANLVLLEGRSIIDG